MKLIIRILLNLILIHHLHIENNRPCEDQNTYHINYSDINSIALVLSIGKELKGKVTSILLDRFLFYK